MYFLLLAIIFGTMWRHADGRDGRPMQWNVYLYTGLSVVCHHSLGFNWASFAVYVLTLINLLSGYKSFTWPWIAYGIKQAIVWTAHKWGLNHAGHTYEFDHGIVKKFYEKNNGFHTWHTAYRFLVPSLIICAIVGNYNLYWLASIVAAGALFPLTNKYWSTEAAAQLREAILGGVVFGGTVYLLM